MGACLVPDALLASQNTNTHFFFVWNNLFFSILNNLLCALLCSFFLVFHMKENKSDHSDVEMKTSIGRSQFTNKRDF